MATPQPRSRKTGIAQILIAASAIGLWLAGRTAWVTVATFDDKAGSDVTDIVGAIWSPELTAYALALLAAVVASLIVGRNGKRIIGVAAAVVAIAASYTPVRLLTSGAEADRALDILTSGAATQHQNTPVTVSDWAVVEDMTIHNFGPILCLIIAALGIVGAVLLIQNPGKTMEKSSSIYENPNARRQRLEQDLQEQPDSERVMWDALDAGIDPTTDNNAGNLANNAGKAANDNPRSAN